MRRFAAVLSLFVFSVSLTVLFMPSAAACPVSPPLPLRGMFLNSTLVVVGKVGTPEKWKAGPMPDPQNANDHYRDYTRAVPIKVEETIKGAPPQNLLVSETRSQWVENKETQTVEQAANPQVHEPGFYSSLDDAPDSRLFFLSESDGEFTEIYISREFNPTKKEFDVYRARIRELAAIYASPKPSKAAIVEWLVSMAEDPITRFEGAAELRMALSTYSAEKEDEEEVSEDEEEQRDVVTEEDSEETDEPVVSETHIEVVNGRGTRAGDGPEEEQKDANQFDLYGSDPEFARLLSPVQKERLVRAFLSVKFNYELSKADDADETEIRSRTTEVANSDGEDVDDGEYEAMLSSGDNELLETVNYLNDRRVIDRIVAELPMAVRIHPADAGNLIEYLADYFADDKLDTLSEKYSAVQYQADSDMVEGEDEAEDLPAEPTVGAEGKPLTPLTEAEKQAAKALRQQRAEAYVPIKTHGQRRAELLGQVMTRLGELAVKKRK